MRNCKFCKRIELLPRRGGLMFCPSCGRTAFAAPWAADYDARAALGMLNELIQALRSGTCSRQRFLDEAMRLAVPFLQASKATFEGLAALDAAPFRWLYKQAERFDEAMSRWERTIATMDFDRWKSGASTPAFEDWLRAYQDGLQAVAELAELYIEPRRDEPDPPDDAGGGSPRLPRPPGPRFSFHQQWPKS